LDIVRFRGTPYDVERMIRATAARDGYETECVLEQEPGASGKIMMEYYVSNVLDGYSVRTIRTSGTKAQRSMPFSSQAQAGNVWLVRGPWLGDYFDELEAFPMGRHDDMVDASALAYLALVEGRGLTDAGDDIRNLFAWRSS